MSLDLTLLQDANRFAVRHDGIEDGMKLYAAASQVLFAGILVVLAASSRLRVGSSALRAALAAGASAALALLIGRLAAIAVPRDRPFVSHHGIHDFLHHAADQSFPSDHATASFAIAGALLWRYPRAGWIAIAAAAVLSATRVLLGVHYPSDVLAGAALGLAASVVFSPRVIARIRLPEGSRAARLLGTAPPH